jgi:hypothetical protein
MVSWEWLVQRRGTSLDDIIRCGINTHSAVREYFQARGASCPTEEEVSAAFLRVNPPAVEQPKPAPPQKTVVKKPATKRPRKKKAT